MSLGQRIAVVALGLSAAGLVGIAHYEGYSDRAISPVPGDVPTIGFGSTRHADGRPVKMGETITPPRALALAARDVAVKEGELKRCLSGVMLYQHEYDAFVDLAYNVGTWAVCRSTIPKKLAAGDFEAACKTILDFRKVQGRNCSLPENQHFFGGVWTRRKAMAHLCLTGERP